MKYKEYFNSGNTILNIDNVPYQTLQELKKENGNFHFEKFLHKGYIARKVIYTMEKYIAREVLKRVRPCKEFDKDDIMRCIEKYEKIYKMTLSDEQVEGVVTLLTNHFAILTGGPGTGKTSVLKCVLFCIEELDKQTKNPNYSPIKLFAPTGKAARRMTEATGVTAQTVLKGILYSPFGDRIRNTLYFKYIIIDEFSMVDVPTFFRFLKALKNYNSRVFLVGDEEQLPSVGEGSLLRDLIHTGLIPTCGLIKTFRQKAGSTLLENINIIKKGAYIPFIEGSDFEKYNTLNNFFDLYFKAVDEFGIDNMTVLTPTRRVGQYSSNRLNSIIQGKINPNKGLSATVTRDGEKQSIIFKVGDPVMQLENREVANGEVGKIVAVDLEKKNVTVQFADTVLTYRKGELRQLDLAYAISIHKSQGSEYPLAFVLCTKEGRLDKNMVYTAVTRAKKKCIIMGNEKLIADACKIESTWNRETALPYLFEEEYIYQKCLDELAS